MQTLTRANHSRERNARLSAKRTQCSRCMRCISVWFSLSGIDVPPRTTNRKNISLSSSKVFSVLVDIEAGTGVVSGSFSIVPSDDGLCELEVGFEEGIEFFLTLNDVRDPKPGSWQDVIEECNCCLHTCVTIGCVRVCHVPKSRQAA